MTLAHGRDDIVQDVQYLSQDDAVIAIARDVRCVPEVGEDGRTRIQRIEIDDVASRHTAAAEAPRVVGFLNLEDRTGDICRVHLEKGFDVVPVNRRAARVSPLAIDWRDAPEVF